MSMWTWDILLVKLNAWYNIEVVRAALITIVMCRPMLCLNPFPSQSRVWLLGIKATDHVNKDVLTPL